MTSRSNRNRRGFEIRGKRAPEVYAARERMMLEMSGKATAAEMAKAIAEAEGEDDWRAIREWVWKAKNRIKIRLSKDAKGPAVHQVRSARPIIEFHGADVLAFMRRWGARSTNAEPDGGADVAG